MVKYQFEIDDETWEEWKLTVPRNKSLERRIIELIEADTDDRIISEERPPPDRGDVREPDARETEPTPEPDVGPDDVAAWVDAIDYDRLEIHLADVDFPTGRDRAACLGAVAAAYGYLRERREATMRDFVRDVMPDYSLGYEVPELEEGDRFRGAWWRHVVKPGLAALPDVRPPASGGSDWSLDE